MVKLKPKVQYNYITQDQLNTALAEFFTQGGRFTWDEFFDYWTAQNMPPNTMLTPVQNTFVGNVLTIFNNI